MKRCFYPHLILYAHLALRYNYGILNHHSLYLLKPDIEYFQVLERGR